MASCFQKTRLATGRAVQCPAPRRMGGAILLLLLLAATAYARKDKGRDDEDSSPKPEPPKAAVSLTKGMALEGVIGALGINRSEAAEQTLERLVTGQIDVGKHAKQAAQLALVHLAIQPTPGREAFLAELFAQPDEAVRPGDKGIYSAPSLRMDAAQIIAKVGSANLRSTLAKNYMQGRVQPAARSLVEGILKSPAPSNFAAQLEMFRASGLPEPVKAEFRGLLLAKNESAVKQALQIEKPPEAPPAGFGDGFGAPAGGAPAGGGSILSTAAQLMGFGRPKPPASGDASPRTGSPFGPAAGSGGNSPPATANAGIPPGGIPVPGAPVFGPAPAAAVPSGAADESTNPDGTRRPARMGGNSAQVRAAFMRRAQEGAFGNVPSLPGGPAAAATAPTAQTPTSMMIDLASKVMNQRPVDASAVARELWKAEFVDSIGSALDEAKTDKKPLVGALASIPITASRERLKKYLHSEWNSGPREIAKVEPITADEIAAGSGSANGFGGSRRRAKKGKGDDGEDTPALGGAFARGKRGGMGGGFAGVGGSQKEDRVHVTEFGQDWLDPGSLVVLKSAGNYGERPKEKPHRRTSPVYPVRRTAASEKRAKEKAEKQRAVEATYEWRDAVQKLVAEWNQRLGAVAEAPVEKDSSAEKETDRGTDKNAGKSADVAKPVKPVSTSVAGEAVATPAAPSPVPAVSMPFPLHPGGKIAKEFHTSWPKNLPAALTGCTSDPLVVHYVRFEEDGDFGKTLAYYRSAISAIPGKPRTVLREVENGKWLDCLQKESTDHHTRSIDVVVTRGEQDDEKKSKLTPLTIDVLVVEIAPLDAEKPTTPTKKHNAVTSTTSR